MQPANLYLLILFYLSSSVQGHTALRHNAGGNPALRRLIPLPSGERLFIQHGQKITHQEAALSKAKVNGNQHARMTNASRPPSNAPGRNTMKTNNALHHTTSMKRTAPASGLRPSASQTHTIKNSRPKTSRGAPKVTHTKEQSLAIDEVLRRREMTEELMNSSAQKIPVDGGSPVYNLSPEGNFATGKLFEARYNEVVAWRKAEMLGIKHPERSVHWNGDQYIGYSASEIASENRHWIEEVTADWLKPTNLSNYDMEHGTFQVLGLSGHEVFLKMNKAFETKYAKTNSTSEAIEAAERVNQKLKNKNEKKVSGLKEWDRLAQLEDSALAVRKMNLEMLQGLELKSGREAPKYAQEFRTPRQVRAGISGLAPEMKLSKKAKKAKKAKKNDH